MLSIMRSVKQVNFSQLADVYEESITLQAEEEYPDRLVNERYLLSRRDFYQFLNTCFFKRAGDVYAVWTVRARYVAALRLEAFQDGLLLEALETLPQERGKGYASALVSGVCDMLREEKDVKLYAHVSKKNTASLALHSRCGFKRILEYAVFTDGSVSHESCTLCIIL